MGLPSSLHSIGRRLVPLLTSREVRPSWSQEGEDLVLARFLEGREAGFYVDVGAHDPYRFSNTAYFYLNGWRGVDIEPDPVGYRALVKQRQRDVVINKGAALEPGRLTYFRFHESALNTFSAALAAEREKSTPYRIAETIEVEVQPLALILKQSVPKGQRIDFMSVDAEGLDLEILKSNDWMSFRPQIVVAEAFSSDLDAFMTCEIATYMKSQGYTAVARTLNSAFFRDDASA